MRHPITVLFTLLFVTASYSQAWIKLPDFTGAVRDDGVAKVIGNKAYVGTGLDPVSASIEFRVFDFATQQWSFLPSMPFTTERQYACAFGTDTALYVTCGLGPSGALTSTYKFSFTTQSWKAVTPKPGKGLMSAVCFQFGNKIILAGGKGNNDSISHEVWQYDIANDVWTQKNKLPFSPLWRAAYSTIGNFGYQIGGIDSVGRFSKHLYQYNSQTDTWQLADSLPTPKGRAYQGMQTRANSLYVFGGFDSLNTYYNDAYVYNTTTNSWDAAPTMPAAPRKGGMSFSDGQNFYYTCGITANGMRLNETWMTNIPVGLAENQAPGEKISVYPNPACQNLSLLFENDAEKIILLIDAAGTVVFEKLCSCSFQSIDVSSYDSGIYFLKVKYPDKESTSKKILLLPNN